MIASWALAVGARPSCAPSAVHSAAPAARHTPRLAALARVRRSATSGTAAGTPASVTRRRRPAPARAQGKGEEGVAAVGHDLNWAHVARDVKKRLAGVVAKRGAKADQLQAWLKQAKLTHTGESDAEHNQAELVAEVEAEFMDLDALQLDVRSWVESGDSDTDGRVAGLLTVRLLQAYHEGAGEPFDDENEDCYWRMQGFLPGELVEALDHDTLKRMIKAYMALPFSGV